MGKRAGMRHKSKDYYLGEMTAGTSICVPMPEHVKKSLMAVSKDKKLSMARFTLQLILDKLSEEDSQLKEWWESVRL
jgi:hypothetical protein